MIRALIIDDEQKARNIVHRYLINLVPEIGEVEHAESVSKAVEMMEYFKPNLVFLDVEMPHQNGFDFIAEKKKAEFDVVFTTAYNQYAIQAIRFSALDYLLKPIDPEELKAAVDRFIQKSQQRSVLYREDLYANLANNIKKNDAKEFKLAVPSSEGIFFFTLDEVVRLEACKNYTYIHLDGKRPFISSKTLKYYHDMLSEFNFIRTHKSHLVNPLFIQQISHNHQFVLLSDGTRVEVSRRKKDEVELYLRLR
ncbi:LytR/AlgR family response regulator transcription factor [Dyadobacter sandarakinus]|uniref:Response regulator transcription factor n=1 Tax=Dyadobacter sandarakinus TaxID=2747268 RepID=A0ABX7I211_9BACT|nr:LytTR family DNA-binding domain-containing protein [Dyadobacter sandarakinus]QRQ99546.1 response regulator transcription factor [Dyadobacter sandarakinus]